MENQEEVQKDALEQSKGLKVLVAVDGSEVSRRF